MEKTIIDFKTKKQKQKEIETLGQEIVNFYYQTKDRIKKIDKLFEEITGFSP